MDYVDIEKGLKWGRPFYSSISIGNIQIERMSLFSMRLALFDCIPMGFRRWGKFSSQSLSQDFYQLLIDQLNGIAFHTACRLGLFNQ